MHKLISCLVPLFVVCYTWSKSSLAAYTDSTLKAPLCFGKSALLQSKHHSIHSFAHIVLLSVFLVAYANGIAESDC